MVDITSGVVGQPIKLLYPNSTFRPAVKFCVNRLAVLQNLRVGGHVGKHFPFIFITGTDLDGFESIQHIDFCENQRIDTIEVNAISGNHCIEPSAPPGPAGGRAELMPDLAQTLAILIRQFGGERAFANPGGLSLDHTQYLIHLCWRNTESSTGTACS